MDVFIKQDFASCKVVSVYLPKDIFPNDGEGTVYEKYISSEPDVVE